MNNVITFECPREWAICICELTREGIAFKATQRCGLAYGYTITITGY